MSECNHDQDCGHEHDEDDWNTVEVPDIEAGAAFRFREDEDGEVEVELSLGDPEDEERVQWYARGFIDCWDHMSEQFAQQEVAEALAEGEIELDD